MKGEFERGTKDGRENRQDWSEQLMKKVSLSSKRNTEVSSIWKSKGGGNYYSGRVN